MITIKEASKFVLDKKDYYEACVRNSYRLPTIQSPIVTKMFLFHVHTGVVWVPKLNEIKLCPCPRAPPTEIVRDELIRTIQANLHTLQQPLLGRFHHLLEHLTKRKADKQWMLELLSTCTQGNHPFFEKDYSYSRPTKSSLNVDQIQIADQENFFAGLPPSRSRHSRHSTQRTFRILVQGDQGQQFQEQQLREHISSLRIQIKKNEEAINQLLQAKRLLQGAGYDVAQSQRMGSPLSQMSQSQRLSAEGKANNCSGVQRDTTPEMNQSEVEGGQCASFMDDDGPNTIRNVDSEAGF